MWGSFIFCAALAVITSDTALDLDRLYDQTEIALEAPPPPEMAKAAKIVLIAGTPSHGTGTHEYLAGLARLADLLRQTKGVWPILVKGGWPTSLAVLNDARAVVMFADGGKGHPLLVPGRFEALEPLRKAGVGFVALHYAVNVTAEGSAPMLALLGGHFDAVLSSSPASTWTADVRALPPHPITRGVRPFVLKDEWYFNMRFVEGATGITPILRAQPPAWVRTSPDARLHAGRPETLAWAYDRPDGGRSFGFTGGHYHDSWGDESFRRIITNGVLWAAKIDVPRGGAKVILPAGALERQLDDKRKK